RGMGVVHRGPRPIFTLLRISVARRGPRWTSGDSGRSSMGVVVSLLNQKGGVGKTSTCHHVSGALCGTGRRILLIDNDPQASLTQGFFGPEAMRACGFGESVAALYDPNFAVVAEAVIRPTGIEGVAIVPGSVRLTHFNQLPPERWGESEYGIRE